MAQEILIGRHVLIGVFVAAMRAKALGAHLDFHEIESVLLGLRNLAAHGVLGFVGSGCLNGLLATRASSSAL